MRSRFLALHLTLLLSAAAPTAASTITFDSLPVPSPFTTASEGGFLVTPLWTDWIVSDDRWSLSPYIAFYGPLFGGRREPGGVVVTAGGVPFTFSAVDVYTIGVPIEYSIAGYRDGGLIFEQGGMVPWLWDFGPWQTLTLGSVPRVDLLMITIFNGPLGSDCPCRNPMGLDNIVLNAVPEPGIVLLFGIASTALVARRASARRSRNARAAAATVSGQESNSPG